MLLIALLCIGVSIYFLRMWILRINRPDEPPYLPGATPILGHLPTIFMDSEKFWTRFKYVVDQTLKFGGVARVELGPTTLYAVADPDDMLVIANTCLEKGKLYDFFKPLAGDGLITSNASTWKNHRKLLNPAFSQTVLDTYTGVFNDQARKIVQDMKKEVDKGLFDHWQYFKINIIETVFRNAFGVEFTDSKFKKKYSTSLGIVLNCLIERMMKFWTYPALVFYFTQNKKKLDENIKIMHDVSNMLLHQAKKHNESISAEGTTTLETEHKSYIKILLQLAQKGIFSDKEVREHSDTLIAAGSDTTSEAIMFTTLLLGANPTVQEKVYAELREVLGDEDRDVVKSDLSQMVYLEAVIKESLRLYPAVPLVLREIDRDVKLKNYTLYAGYTCILCLLGAHLHPMWGPDRHQFRPERWLDPTQLPKNSSAFAAFFVGKRACIGKVYTIMLMKTVLAHLIRQYRVTADITNLRLKMDITLKPVSGYFISIENRC